MRQHNYPLKKNTDKDVREMLEKERKYWEAHHEPELKRIHGLASSDESAIAKGELQGKIIGMNRMKWLAAAVITGLLGIGGLQWWYV